MALAPVLRTASTALGLVFGLVAASPAAAQLPPDVDAVAEHLALLGYQCERKPDGLQCRHEQNVNTNVRGVQGGTLLITYFATEDAAKAPERRLGVLELVNTMNANSASVIFFIDGDGDLGASTWFPGRYDKTRFGQIVERWNTDLREALQRDPEASRALIR
jgi:hypothetical protein